MLIPAVIWLAAAIAVIAVLIVKYKNSSISENDVIYLPGTLFVTAAVIYAVAAVFGTITLYVGNIISTIAAFFFIICGVNMMLKQLNQRVTMTGESSFVSASLLGKKTEYSFSDYRDFNKARDGSAVLYMNKGEIKIDRMAIKDEKFFRKLRDAEKKNAYEAKKNK